ncbi:hypothetical protein HIM_09159 [Hirsutella minnesotensis 3608]|uniref:Uncharacterized protein n=1 Tax=Hirsutella minnesotensis 3608 TaxID=1043627 RepID=A0A0F7ZLS9_9HYPO|nr:hypothetical protein HIM_09159 [Hirsutella minnesotensis 3608]
MIVHANMNEPIAVVGSACHFAGGTTSPSKLWELLREPRDVRSKIPDGRLSADGFHHPSSAYHGHSNVRHAYLLDEDVGCFDAEFFGINPIEAKAIDPQQRLLMETVFEGIEDAGMTVRDLRGSDTSIFVGVMCDDYAALQVRDLQLAPTYFATGTAQSILSNRVSYFFDWHGPSVTLDTACSSSLVAVHMAVQALRSGESRLVLDDEKLFNRRLRVDKAYHSNHMLPCFDPYVESLRRSGVQAHKPSGTRPTWISSVHGAKVDSEFGLGDTYWAENMTKPVLFLQALTAAVAVAEYDLVVEIGPHPALQGPATQTIHEVLERGIPYHGLLSRGTDAVKAPSTALGFLWSHLDETTVCLDSYERALADDERPFEVVKGLPAYQWNHEARHWHESRTSRRTRLRSRPVHPLLGHLTPDSSAHHMSWRHLLRASEIEWLSGHRIQGQIVFPAAGYVCAALEAALLAAGDDEVGLVELGDFVIHQAVTFDEDDSAIEVLISLEDVFRPRPDCIQAKFTYSASLTAEADDLTLAASGELRVKLGRPDSAVLPARQPPTPQMIGVDPERFYEFVASLGYNFGGSFRALTSINRKYGKSSCLVQTSEPSPSDLVKLLVRPAELDASFQAIILAYSYPGDDQLLTMHLPTSIGKIRIDPSLCEGENPSLAADSLVTARLGKGAGILGEVSLYTDGSSCAMVQMQDVKLVPLSRMAVGDYRRVFSRTHWVNSIPDGMAAACDTLLTQYHEDLRTALERASTFYLRQFDWDVLADDPLRSQGLTSHYLRYAQNIASEMEACRHKRPQEKWLKDAVEDIIEATRPFEQDPAIRAVHLVGQQMPRVLRGETTMLEEFRNEALLDEYYMNGFGFRQSRQWLARAVSQITDRHLHLNILELGAGTSSDEDNARRPMTNDFLTYTFINNSPDLQETADEATRTYFKALDLERDPLEQGYAEGAYDLVIAPFTLHATEQLERTLRHVRKLLRPGGFLIAAEGSGDDEPSGVHGFVSGTLPGWWLGADEGRALSPLIATGKWSKLLRLTGFSGIDTTAPQAFENVLKMTVFVSQAVDERVMLLREPLATAAASSPARVKNLVIVGGQTEQVAKLVEDLKSLNFAEETHVFQTLLDVDYSVIQPDSAVISLTELDEPVFKALDPERFDAFRSMFNDEKTLLWLTSGRLGREPFANMTIGFGRTAVHETPTLRLQCLDVADPQKLEARTVAEVLLRLHVATSPAVEQVRASRMLWVVEAEIVLDDAGRQLVPRLRPVTARNDRYNSARQPISHEVDLTKSIVRVYQGDEGWSAEELPQADLAKSADQQVMQLRTVRSVMSAIRTPIGPRYLVLGVDSHTAVSYLALVSSLTSLFKFQEDSVIPCPLSANVSSDNLIDNVAAHLVATAIIAPMFGGQTLVLHNASMSVARAAAAQAAAKGVTVVYAADLTSRDEVPDTWIRLPPCASQTETRRMFPTNVACFVGLSDHETRPSENEATIQACLPLHCRKETAATLYFAEGCDDGSSCDALLRYLLHDALGYADAKGCDDGSPCDALLRYLLHDALGYADKVQVEAGSRAESVEVGRLSSGTVRPTHPATIIDWASSTSLTAYATRLDSMPMFQDDKTYWMVGLTSALGISLCDWMIDRGAKSLVLSSRSPNISADWIAAHQRKGVRVTVIPCDISDEVHLKLAHNLICATLPPVAGVLNGAMVLRDVSIHNMSFEQMVEVLRPKVNGTINLDRLFWDAKLDFFILFSSTSCVAGNPGQANYSAANAFLCGLAAQRRERGLAATALHCGAIIGAGYMARESSKALDLTVSKMAMMHLSEEDYHQLFVEAIDAGHADSPEPAELTTGFLDIQANSANNPRWQSNPTFESFVIHQSGVQEDKDGKKAGASVQNRLQACQSQQDVLDVVKETFAAQLRYELQMTTPDDDLMAMRGNEMGLDSLISVDIRSWLLKDFGVSIPVLKIMGNDTMGTIAEHTAQSVPRELIPQVKADETGPSIVEPTQAAA